MMLFSACFFTIFAIYQADATSQGAVRFVRNNIATTSQLWSSGIVQIYYDFDWGNICDDDDFGQNEADVLCHQFSYSGASSYSNTGSTATYGSDSTSTALEDVYCSSSSYLTITQCTFTQSSSFTSCSDSDDVIVNCYTTRIWSSPTSGDIRLTGGTYSNQGLLEVYCNDEWGTVCGDFFYDTQARVACRQLGYNYYDDYNHLSQQGSSSQSIWLHFLSGCSSSNSCLTECEACPVSAESGCAHYEDVTLECEYDSSYSKVYSSTSDTCDYSDSAVSEGAVRFVRYDRPDTSQAWSSGIVQIYYGGSWGNICDDDYSFGQYEADVLCHQFGYTGASSYSNTGTTPLSYGSDSTSAALESVSCSSDSYLAISQCSLTAANSYSTCNNDVTVTCYATRIWDSPEDGDIRLTGGTYSNEGLLEVYCNDEWGTVCDDDFFSTEATVACDQLGYNGYTNYDHLSQRGTSQSIWLQYFTGCLSWYSCLTSCGSCPSTAVTGCTHTEDITLECKYDSSEFSSYTTTDSYCDSGTIDLSGLASAVVIIIVVVSVVCCLICVAIIAIPICVCACIGFGVGAASSRSTARSTVVAQPMPVMTTNGSGMTYQPALASFPPQIGIPKESPA